jgi:TonB-linked SusC/RagA family outer membrane protein
MKKLEMGSRVKLTLKTPVCILFCSALLFSTSLLHARNYQDSISIDRNNANLKDILSDIHEQAGYDYSMNNAVLKKAKPVDIHVRNESVTRVMELCMKDQPLSYSIRNNIIIIIDRVAVQGVQTRNDTLLTVSGRIRDNNNQPVFANVMVKGSRYGSSSNTNGDFRLEAVGKNSILLISGVGIEDLEIKINGRTNLGTILIKTKQKEEETVIVNTGYDQKKATQTPGAFDVLPRARYQELAGTDPIERLKRITGIPVIPANARSSASGQILIRGISSLTPSIQKPLIIVDNFPYKGELNNLNPNDIESVTILKDAAAASIWGARAANGVIVITTRKGDFNQRRVIEFSSIFSIGNEPNLSKLDMMASADMIEVQSELFRLDYGLDDTADGRHLFLPEVYELLLKHRNGLISDAEKETQLDLLRKTDLRNEYQRFYQNPFTQQYAVSYRGGAANFNHYFSGGFDRSRNELGAGYSRVSLRDNTVYKFRNILRLTSLLAYTDSHNTDGRPAYGSIATSKGSLAPYTRFADEYGNALPVYNYYRAGYIDTAGGGKLLDWRYYPLTDDQSIDQTTHTKHFTLTLGLNYTITPELALELQYDYQRGKTQDKTLYGENSYFARDLINSFYQPADDFFAIPAGNIFDQFENTLTARHARGQLKYNRNRTHYILNMLAGFERGQVVNSYEVLRYYGYDAKRKTQQPVDYAALYPTYISQEASNIPGTPPPGQTTNRFISFYSNLVLVVNKRYSLQASLRRDGSNLFGVNTKDKWKPLWSASIGWEISKEPFYHAVALPFLKIRLSYGFTGNVNPANVAVPTLSYRGRNVLTDTRYSQVANFVNPNLRWEQAAMLNAALEFGTKNKRISGNIEYYTKHTSELYGNPPVDNTTGIPLTVVANMADMKGRGWDIRINTLNIDRSFKWRTEYILNTYKDRITKYNRDKPPTGSDLVKDGLNTIVGYPAYPYTAYRWNGLNPQTGDPIGSLQGKPSQEWAKITNKESTLDDVKYIGSLIPLISGALHDSFEWKGIALQVQMIYRFRYYFRRESINYGSLVTNQAGHPDYRLRWKQPGDEASTTIPSFVAQPDKARDNFYTYSEQFATKGDNIRIQYIRIAYDFPAIKMQRLPVQQLSFFAMMDNIGMIWKANKHDLDPDYPGLPPVRTVSFGLRATI